MRRLAALVLLAGCASAEAPVAATEATAAPSEAAPAEATPAAAPQHFGSAFTVQETIAAKALLADPAAHVGQTIRVEGRIADVCQKAGCWMVLTDEAKNLRVTMKDHAFSVDKAGTGGLAVVEGTLVEKPNDPAEAAHYASESAHPDVAPEATAGDKKYELVATAVEIRRG